jgi:glycosyltransferase involved in cell wall biosynthesis
VEFPGAIYDDMLLAPWMLSASVFAYPVAIGLSVLHAFGYGLPVVTSDDIASHNPEIEGLRAGENGLLYRDGDIDDFASALNVCMTGGEAWDAMSHAARATVLEGGEFSVDGMVNGIAAAVRDAVEHVAVQAATRSRKPSSKLTMGS